MSQTTHIITNTITNTKEQAMPASKDDDFEIVNPSEIEFVKRGRKAQVNPELVARLSTLSKGQTMAIKKDDFKADPKSDTFAKDKARISSQIRAASVAAKVKKISINWNAQGVPFVTVVS